MATPQTIKLTGFDSHLLTNVRYEIGADTITDFLRTQFAEAAYPDVAPKFLTVSFDHQAVQTCINGIFDRAINEAITDHREVTNVSVKVSTLIDPKGKHNAIFVPTVTLTTTDPMTEEYAQSALKCVDIDAANLAVDREMGMFAATCFTKSKAQVDIDPEVKPWHDLKTTDPDRFYELAGLAYRHFNGKPWKGSWSLERSEEENFLYWVMSNHPDVDAFVQLVAAAPTAAPTVNNEQLTVNNAQTTANTNNQTTTPTPMAKTANTNIPAGYKVAPAADPTNAEAIASQFAPQFEKALSAVSPSGKKLADCTQLWAATTRPNDMPGRIIMCTVKESEQTYHTFTFDCKDRHRDSFTMDEGMKFDWLSVDAMIKAFTGQASVMDCVKEGCKRRLTGQTTAAPKAATKTAPEPQTAEPQAQTAAPAEDATASAEAASAPFPKAQTKTAPAAPSASNASEQNGEPQTTATQTPSVFQTYECSQTPAFYYHLYGEGENSGIVVIHRETGDIRQHCANQTMESSRALIKQHGMTEVQPIPTVVITALIKEGVIKAPMAVNNEQLTVNNDHADEKAAAEQAAAEQREREEREAAERAEQERIAKEQAEREAAERQAREQAEMEQLLKEQREREEAERKAVEEKAAAEKAEQERIEREKREAEERAEQERIEQEKAAAKAKAATIAPRHEKFDEVLWHVENDIPVYLHGPAGTGKNVMCKQIAEQLGLEFSFANAVQNSFDILGYGNAQGEYVATEFYHAFTEGKLFMLDEMDASIPEVLVILNAAIANRYCVFPVVGKVDAHPNFRIVAAGNTIGTGADQNYTGRAAIDAASLNRFAKIALDYSHAIEMGITHQNGELVEFMEALREAVRNARFDVVISYRQTIHLMKMIESGKFEIAHCIRRTCLPTQNLDDIRILAENIMTSGHNKYTAALKQLCEKMRRDNKYAA